MKRFSIKDVGYDIDEVNRFIDIVIKRLETLDNENKTYKSEIASLNEKLKENNNNDDKLAKAILAAQETSDRMKELAREEANMIIDEAKRNASAIIRNALLEAEKTDLEAMLLKKNITVYKARVVSLLESQLNIAKELDKVELDKF